ncbi:glycosyltransferase [Desulfovibrio sp. ZJ200]|uniref:glycosyltransferase n=1 Tax=Desulfovibrio sp. ZJ200 TaxID=2709792 RepID=UPI00321761BA
MPCIVLARDHAPVTDRCLESVLHRSLYRALDLILVDNGSTKEDAWVLCNAYDGHPQVSVIHWDWPFNFSKINNMAAERTRGELLVFLNNDAKVITPDWVEILAGYALQPRIGAVAPKLLYPDGSIQHAGVVMLGTAHIVREAFKGRPDDSEEYFARTQAAHWVCVVTSVCLMVEKHKFLESGGLEERLAVTFNDIDFCCWLYEAGYRNVYTPYAILRHHEFTSRSAVEDTPEKQLRAHKENSYMRDRWVALAVDPFYSIHFSRQEDTYRIIRPNEGSVTAWSAPHGLHAGREGGESK